MSGNATRLRTLKAIGGLNGLRVLAYRLGLKLGLHPVQHVKATLPEAGPFFFTPAAVHGDRSAPATWRDTAVLFGAYPVAIGRTPPAWTRDLLAEPEASDPSPDELLPWWRIGDFSGGDIKRIWELSRFDWAMAFAQQAIGGRHRCNRPPQPLDRRLGPGPIRPIAAPIGNARRKPRYA